MFNGNSVRLAVKIRSWIPTQAEWTKAARCIQSEEKERIGQFYFKKDAKAAMVGRLLLRFAVSRLLNVPSSSLVFDRTEKGKPILVSHRDFTTNKRDISFNVSHQGDYVVFAADRCRDVGVDVMKVEWPRNTAVSAFFQTMETQFTQSEWMEVKCHKDEMDQLKVFFRLWCLKESIVKAYGIGIGFNVSRLDFSFKTKDIVEGQMVADTEVDIDGEAAPEWIFEETFLDRHCLAVATTNSIQGGPTSAQTDERYKPTPFHVLDIHEVLAGCEPLAGNCPDQKYWELFSSREEAPVLPR